MVTLLSDGQYRPGPGEVVFRPSGRSPALWLAICLVLGAACLIAGGTVGLPPWGRLALGGLLGLGALASWWALKAARKPTAWQLCLSATGLAIRMRSYLNTHIREDAPIIVQFDHQAISWVRKVKELHRRPMANEGDSMAWQAHLDVCVQTDDLSPVVVALNSHRLNEVAGRGTKPATVQHFPVRLIGESIFRIRWNGIVPNLDQALRELGRTLQVRPELEIREEPWAQLTGEQQEARIRDHLVRGEMFEARWLLRRLHSCSLAEADDEANRMLLDELRSKPGA